MKLEEALQTSRFEDDLHKATLNILYTAYWLKTNIGTVLKDNGLTSEQFNVLRILKGKHPEAMCNKDIGNRMIEKSSNVPRIADRLVVKKLVKRTVSKEDKRETLLQLTEKGLETLSKANKAVSSARDKIVSLTEKDAKTLNQLLEKLRANNQ